MIIEFKVKNFRSIKDEIVLSLEASGSKSKPDNVFTIKTKGGKTFKLLKSAVIYGPNASGKSNILRAFWSFKQLVNQSFRNDVNDTIIYAEPFELSRETRSLPTIFTFNFIARDKYQYIYSIAISREKGIIEESLMHYAEKNPKLIYKRKGRKVELKNPAFFEEKVTAAAINPKRLFLSELGNSGIKYWESLRNYIVLGNEVVNSSAPATVRKTLETAKAIFEGKGKEFADARRKLIKLIQLSDLGIRDVSLEEERLLRTYVSGNVVSEEQEPYGEVKKEKRFKTHHDLYNGKKVEGTVEFDLIKQGSAGTLALVGLSAEILLSLTCKDGIPVWVDEIDNSMHPFLCRFLINLFHHPKSNPTCSQLIFATHETTLLDKNNFRKDQIWITAKDAHGVTQLYSVHDLDVEGLRDDIPFDKWYMSGKFGGLPKIKELDFIFDRD